jgi:hypothetical protein
MNLRNPSSLIRSRFGAEEDELDDEAPSTDPMGSALPNTTPDTGRIDKFLITSLRFILYVI